MAGTRNGIYSPGQAEILFDVWPEEAEWFVLGGPANSNEGQTVKAKYPDVNCIAFEPNPMMFEAQSKLGFPGDLHPYALLDEDTNAILKTPGDRDISSSICRDMSDCNCINTHVVARSLDSLSEELGPFTNVVLWIDIEHAELKCLEGAKKLLESGQILLVNVEVFKRHLYAPIADLLASYGLREIKRWNGGIMPEMYDVVFKKV